MDKLNFVRDGESKLPPGFRFQPTDEEIVFQYLARKVFSYPLPASIIPELNIFGFNPWELPGNSEQDRYFFSYNATSYRSFMMNRGISSAGHGGFWKASLGADKQIIVSKRMPIVGIRKTLVFYKGKHPNAARTNWTMHLYCIALSKSNAANNSNIHRSHKGSLIQIGNWALCHIFLKKRNSKLNEVIDDSSSLRDYDTIEADMSDTDSFSGSSSSSSCSSSSPDSDTSEVTSSSVEN